MGVGRDEKRWLAQLDQLADGTDGFSHGERSEGNLPDSDRDESPILCRTRFRNLLSLAAVSQCICRRARSIKGHHPAPLGTRAMERNEEAEGHL